MKPAAGGKRCDTGLLVLRSVVADWSGYPLWSVSTLATPFCHTTLWKSLGVPEQPGAPVEPPLGEGGRRVRRGKKVPVSPVSPVAGLEKVLGRGPRALQAGSLRPLGQSTLAARVRLPGREWPEAGRLLRAVLLWPLHSLSSRPGHTWVCS